MAFSIAGAGAAALGYERGVDMRLDRERLAGIEGRAVERHGIDMAEADYRSRARAPADAVRGDAMQGIDYRSGQRSYEEGTRKPLAAVQARHVLDDERASNAEARAQEAAKRAQAQEGRAAQSHAYNLAAQVSPDKKRRAQELSIEMGELDAELQRELAPLRAAGDKQEAMNRIMASRQQTYETFAKTFYELGPEAVVSAFNAWPGSKVTDAVAFRQVQTPQGPVHALVDADGKVLDDPTTGQPAQLTEKELKGLYASAQARNAVKGKRNVVKAKDADGNEALVDADTGQLIGSMQLDEQDNPKWVPAGEGGQAPPPKLPPNPTASDLREYYRAHGFSPEEVESALKQQGQAQAEPPPRPTRPPPVTEVHRRVADDARDLLRTGSQPELFEFWRENGEMLRQADPDLVEQFRVRLESVRPQPQNPGIGGAAERIMEGITGFLPERQKPGSQGWGGIGQPAPSRQRGIEDDAPR
jgi:hypothetical protein